MPASIIVVCLFDIWYSNGIIAGIFDELLLN